MTNIQIVWKRNRLARRISIRIKPGRQVCVTRPYSISLTEAHDFLLKNKNWIEEKCNQIESQSLNLKVKLQNGSALPFLGGFVKLELNIENIPKSSIVLIDDILKVVVSSHELIYAKNSSEIYKEKKIINIIENWYKEEALKRALDIAQIYSSQLGVLPNTITIKFFRSRWGACSVKKDIMLNWQIITLKPDLFDYVVAHELCHLIYMNHSSKFYSLLDKLGFDKKYFKNQFKNLRPIQFEYE